MSVSTMSLDPHTFDVKELDEPRFIDRISDLHIGDMVVFKKYSLDESVVERKKPMRVVDAASRIYRNDHEDEEFEIYSFEVVQSAVDVEGDWKGANTYTLCDSHNSINGDYYSPRRYDNGAVIEIAVVAEVDEPDLDVSLSVRDLEKRILSKRAD